jgi:hypothetical protein
MRLLAVLLLLTACQPAPISDVLTCIRDLHTEVATEDAAEDR